MKYQCVFSILDMINVAKDNTGDEMNPQNAEETEQESLDRKLGVRLRQKSTYTPDTAMITFSDKPWGYVCWHGWIIGIDIPGWWLTYPSEKYESQLGSLFPKYGKKSKPPTSL